MSVTELQNLKLSGWGIKEAGKLIIEKSFKLGTTTVSGDDTENGQTKSVLPRFHCGISQPPTLGVVCHYGNNNDTASGSHYIDYKLDNVLFTRPL